MINVNTQWNITLFLLNRFHCAIVLVLRVIFLYILMSAMVAKQKNSDKHRTLKEDWTERFFLSNAVVSYRV